MNCESPNDYCFNLRFLEWQSKIGPKYRASNQVGGCLNNQYGIKYNCPPATICREGIDGWPAVNASATLDGLFGIGISPLPTYANGKKLTAIYRVTIGGTVFTAPKGTKYLVDYRQLKYPINIELFNMNQSYNVGIEDIKGSRIIRYKWIVREGPQ